MSSEIKNWYFASDPAKHVSQVVIEFFPDEQIESLIDTLKVKGVITFVDPGGWAADVLVICDQHTGIQTPVLFINASGAVQMLPQDMRKMRVALAFYKFPSSTILQFFIHVHVPMLENTFGTPFFVERSYQTSDHGTQELINNILAQKTFKTCFVAEDGPGQVKGFYGFETSLSPECRVELKRQWADLLAYQMSLSPDKVDYEMALDMYNSENPLDELPILDQNV